MNKWSLSIVMLSLALSQSVFAQSASFFSCGQYQLQIFQNDWNYEDGHAEYLRSPDGKDLGFDMKKGAQGLPVITNIEGQSVLIPCKLIVSGPNGGVG